MTVGLMELAFKSVGVDLSEAYEKEENKEE